MQKPRLTHEWLGSDNRIVASSEVSDDRSDDHKFLDSSKQILKNACVFAIYIPGINGA